MQKGIDSLCKEDNVELKKYEILYTAYADEIRNLWTRSVFLGAFMTLAWGGYGALQLKFITRECEKFDINAYAIASLGLCAVIIMLSMLWIAMAKGSKFVQEAHERHIDDFNFDENDIKKLFCKLESYEYKTRQDDCGDNKEINKDLNPNLFFGEVMKPYRYSPNKINIALGWVSFLIACMLVIVHIYRLDIECLKCLFMIVFVLALYPLSRFIKKQVKGGKTDTRLNF